jgi:hypothetical protein
MPGDSLKFSANSMLTGKNRLKGIIFVQEGKP